MSQAGSASVGIFPTFQGFRSTVTREVDATATAASTSFGERFRSGVVGAAKGVGAAVAGGITAATAVAAVGVGAIFKKGLERSLNIQDATKQLEGLGKSAEDVEQIMGNALNSVKGTAFGLDAAATLAGTVIAAGVKPGQELERTLKLTADAATIARTDLGEMGQIFGKVAASGKLNTEVLNQFSQRGVPLLQFVADEFGVTADEASEMVSRGEVDFARFQSALEAGVGGAALKSGETARGAWANIGAAFGRLGAMFTGSAVASAPTLFQSIAAAVDRAATTLEPYAAQFEGVLTPAIENAAAWIDRIDFQVVADNVKSAFTSVRDSVRGVVEAFQTGDFSGVGGAFGDIAAVARPLFPLFVELGKGLGGIAGSIGEVIAAGLPLLVPILEGFANALVFLGDNPAILAGALIVLAGAFAAQRATASAALALAPLQLAADIARTAALAANTRVMLANSTAAVGNAAATRANFLTRLPSTVAILASVQAFIASTAAMVAQRAVMVAGAVATGIATAAQWAFNAALNANPIGIIILAIAALVAGLVFFFTQTELGKEVWANVSQFFIDTWNNIVTVFTAAFQGISDFFAAVWDGIVAFAIFYVSTVRAVIITVVTAIVNAWNGFWTGIGNFFRGVWEGILAFLRQIAIAIVVAVLQFVNGVRDNINNAVRFVQELPGKILGFLGNLGGLLVNSGKALIQGFIDGIKNMIGSVGKAIGGVMDFVSGFFPRSPAKRGPFSGSGWTKLRSSGAAIADQFAEGFDDASPDLNARLNAAITAPAVMRGAPDSGPQVGRAEAGGAFNNYGTIQVTDERALVAEVEKRKRRALASQGLVSRVGVAS